MKIRIKRFMCLAMAVSMILGCFVLNVVAAETNPKDVARRASGSFKVTVEPGVIATGNTKLPLDAGETVTVKAAYTPYPTSVDVGVIDEDGIFHYETVENGSIDITFLISERGNYVFGIRNNGDSDIEVSGYIKY